MAGWLAGWAGWLAGWLANVSKRFILVREGQRQRARQPSQATPPYHRRPKPGVGDISAQRHTVTTIFTPPFFAFFARFLTLYLYVFASAHGRTKYPFFRVVRPIPHPLATKARRRQRQNPFRNCAFFRVHCIFVSVQHQSAPQTAPTLRAFSPIRA